VLKPSRLIGSEQEGISVNMMVSVARSGSAKKEDPPNSFATQVLAMVCVPKCQWTNLYATYMSLLTF
jgi:hypothetical protein